MRAVPTRGPGPGVTVFEPLRTLFDLHQLIAGRVSESRPWPAGRRFES